MSMIVPMTVRAAESEHEISQALSWGVGGIALLILLFLIGALIAFGGGREHS